MVVDDFLAAFFYENLQARLISLLEEDSLQKAGIGTASDYTIQEGVRGDYISWLGKENEDEALFLAQMEDFRKTLNLSLLLSLKSFEFHFASYPPGSFYARHLDQFKERNNRMISFVLYFNDNWKPEYEGFLRIYNGDEVIDFEPKGNRLVLFRSDIMEHEVLPTKVYRNSITGWFLYQPHDLSFFSY